MVIIAASVLINAMKAIFSVAMLHYVEGAGAIGPFSEDELHNAVRVKA